MKEIIIAVPDRFGQELKPEKVNSEIKGKLVRCEKCIYGDDFDCPAPLPTGYLCQKGHGSHTGDWYCADGERREIND